MAWTTPGTATAGSVLTAAFLNTNLRDNLNVLAPLAAAWTSWSPTTSGFTKGNGTETAKYAQVGKTVLFSYSFVLGSTSSITGNPQFSLPVTQSSSPSQITANAVIDDAGVIGYSAVVILQGSTAYLRAVNASGTYASLAFTSSTIPMTWGTSDGFYTIGTYEAA